MQRRSLKYLNKSADAGNPELCGADGFDHHEEYCCNCLVAKFKWPDYEKEACKQCKSRLAKMDSGGKS
jgi:hypothetical protein